MKSLIENEELLNDPDMIRIDVSKGRIEFWLTIVSYRDQDTRQMVVYSPSLELSGYGETTEKAKAMLQFSVNEFGIFLLSLTSKKMETELNALGWSHDKLKNKVYSTFLNDLDSKLQDLNTVGDSVELMKMTA
ncbi:MAG: hypothetical protein ACK5Z2_17950 [Bacteroidota bacterium]